MDQIKRIQKAFSAQAGKYGDGSLTLAREDYIKWMVDSLPVEPDFEVLDVAAGTAHVGRGLAPRVKHVTAFDVTPEMLAEGAAAAARAGIENMSFESGNAERLPFEDGSFDLVVARFAIHHFVEPSVQVAEMARVCRASGFVGLIDMVSPAEAELAGQYNYWERVRDPSHTEALSAEGLAGLISGAGLVQTHVDFTEIEVDLEKWLGLTEPGEGAERAIRSALEQEIGGGCATGLRPFARDEKLKFRHVWMIVVGRKGGS